MDNPYDGYIALTTFEVKAYYHDDPPTTVKQGEILLFIKKFEEEYEFVHNDRYVYVTEECLTKNLKIYSDVYQEQFSHLDKNHLYFGQLNVNDSFVLENNGVKDTYYKIGEYTTKDGKKYNCVKNQEYFEADNVDEFNINNITFFPEDFLIEKNYKFIISRDEEGLDGTYNFMKPKAFKFVEPIKVCDFIINHQKMLDVIECLFQGKELTLELKNVYTNYKEDMENREYQMCGFFGTELLYLPDLLEHMKTNKYTTKSRSW